MMYRNRKHRKAPFLQLPNRAIYLMIHVSHKKPVLRLKRVTPSPTFIKSNILSTSYCFGENQRRFVAISQETVSIQIRKTWSNVRNCIEFLIAGKRYTQRNKKQYTITCIVNRFSSDNMDIISKRYSWQFESHPQALETVLLLL